MQQDRRREMTSARGILLITDHLPAPSGGGGSVYPHLLLATVARRFGWAVDAVCLQAMEKAPQWARLPVRESYIRRCFFPWRLQFAGHCLGGSIAFHLSTKPWTFIRKWCRSNPMGPVVVNFTQRAGWLTHVPTKHRGIRMVLTQEVIYQRVMGYKDAGVPLDFEPLTRDQEAALLQSADVVSAIQTDDAAEFRRLAGDRQIALLPPPFPVNPLPPARSVQGRCLFVGGKAQTNQVGLNWFLERCWPEVLQRFPKANLQVCGSVGRSINRPIPPGVEIAGEVEDLQPAYAEAAVCIAPLLFGSGIKLKVLEAAAFGRAVVATSIGLQGMDDWGQDAVWRADDPVDFANAVVRLLEQPDERTRRAANQIERLRQLHEPDLIAETFHECLCRSRH